MDSKYLDSKCFQIREKCQFYPEGIYFPQYVRFNLFNVEYWYGVPADKDAESLVKVFLECTSSMGESLSDFLNSIHKNNWNNEENRKQLNDVKDSATAKGVIKAANNCYDAWAGGRLKKKLAPRP